MKLSRLFEAILGRKTLVAVDKDVYKRQAFDSALHICISKNTHRLLLPENMVRAAPDDDAVGFAGQLTKQLMLLCVDGEFRIERGL